MPKYLQTVVLCQQALTSYNYSFRKKKQKIGHKFKEIMATFFLHIVKRYLTMKPKNSANLNKYKEDHTWVQYRQAAEK